jgi:hypothetical protein
LRAEQVGDTLLTGGTVDWTDVFLGEHGVVLVGLLVLTCEQHVVQVFDLATEIKKIPVTVRNSSQGLTAYIFFEAQEFLAHLVFFGEHVAQVVQQLLQFVHQTLLQVFEV